MVKYEPALTAFTLLVQAALGVLLVAALWSAGLADVPPLLIGRLLTGTVVLLAAGLLLSLLHLGTPVRAVRAVRRVASSWLSREILLSLLFAVLALATGWLYWTGRGVPALLWVPVLGGAAAVWAMASVYTHTVRPAWSTFYTPVSFFTAALLLGGAAALPVLIYAAGRGEMSGEAFPQALGVITLAAAAGLAAQLAALPLYLRALRSGPPAAQAGLRVLRGPGRAALLLRMVASVLGMLALVGARLFASRAGADPAALCWVGVIALVAGEGTARLLFFRSGVSTDVG